MYSPGQNPPCRFFKVHFFFGIWFLYSVVLVPTVHQSESTICTHISPLSFTFRFAQGTEKSSLCYMLGSHHLSILHIASIVYTCQSQSLHTSHYPPLPPPFICSLCLYLYFFFSNKIIYTIFLNSTYMH